MFIHRFHRGLANTLAIVLLLIATTETLRNVNLKIIR